MSFRSRAVSFFIRSWFSSHQRISYLPRIICNLKCCSTGHPISQPIILSTESIVAVLVIFLQGRLIVIAGTTLSLILACSCGPPTRQGRFSITRISDLRSSVHHIDSLFGHTSLHVLLKYQAYAFLPCQGFHLD